MLLKLRKRLNAYPEECANYIIRATIAEEIKSIEKLPNPYIFSHGERRFPGERKYLQERTLIQCPKNAKDKDALLLLCCAFTATFLSLHTFSVSHTGGADGTTSRTWKGKSERL